MCVCINPIGIQAYIYLFLSISRSVSIVTKACTRTPVRHRWLPNTNCDRRSNVTPNLYILHFDLLRMQKVEKTQQTKPHSTHIQTHIVTLQVRAAKKCRRQQQQQRSHSQSQLQIQLQWQMLTLLLLLVRLLLRKRDLESSGT